MNAPKPVPVRPYVVYVKGERARVIRAANKAHALAFHTATTIRVELASPDDMYQAAIDGIPVEAAPTTADAVANDPRV